MSRTTSKKDRKNSRNADRVFNIKGSGKKYQRFLEKENGIYYTEKKKKNDKN